VNPISIIFLRCIDQNQPEGPRALGGPLSNALRPLMVVGLLAALGSDEAPANQGSIYNHFYTAESTERDTAKTGGFKDESDLDPIFLFTTQVKGSVQLYRLYNASVGDHFYTTNEDERYGATKQGWVDESADHPLYVFHQAIPDELRPHAVQLRRFWLDGATDHFYATDQQDAKNALRHGQEESTKEWITVFNAPVEYNGVSAVRLWRLYHPGPSDDNLTTRQRYDGLLQGGGTSSGGGGGGGGAGVSAGTKPSIGHTIQSGKLVVSGKSFAHGARVDFQISVRGNIAGAADLRTGYAHTTADGSGSFSGLSLDLKTILPAFTNPGGSGVVVSGAVAGETVSVVAKDGDATTYDNNQPGVSNVDSFTVPP
jgi:hypothetical protein